MLEFPKFITKLNKKTFFYFESTISIREGMEEIYENTIKLIEMIPKDLSHLIIVEHMSNQKMPSTIGKYVIKKTKKFGKSSLTYYI